MPNFNETPTDVILDLTHFISTVELMDRSGDGTDGNYHREYIDIGIRVAPVNQITKGTNPNYEEMLKLLEDLKEFTRRKQKKGVKPNYTLTLISHNMVLVAQGYMDKVRARVQYTDNVTDFFFKMTCDSYTVSHGANAVRKHLLDAAIADIAAHAI